MNWRQTIGLVIAIGAIIALCFFVVFPAFYSEKVPEKISEKAEDIEKSQATAEGEDRSVLPKLKGVNWKAQPKKPAEKKPAEKTAEKAKPVAGKESAGLVNAGQAKEVKPEPVLELQEMTWYEQEGYVVVVGTVKNVSGKSIPSVEVHAMFEGKDRWLIASEHAMIDLNPIFPGQISQFTVISRYYPEITDVVLDFRKFSGERIPWNETEGQEGEPVEEEVGEGDAEGETAGEPVAPVSQ